MYKRLIMILLILSIGLIVIGCTSTMSKVPDNFDNDLWVDSIKVINIIYDTYDNNNNFLVEEENIIEQYFKIYENRVYDNIDENKLINRIRKVYINYNDFLISKKLDLGLEESSIELENSLMKLKELQNELLK